MAFLKIVEKNFFKEKTTYYRIHKIILTIFFFSPEKDQIYIQLCI